VFNPQKIQCTGYTGWFREKDQHFERW